MPDSRRRLLDNMQNLARATGKTVTIGAYGHRDDFFATCGDVEYQGSTPEAALQSVTGKVVEDAQRGVREAQATIDGYLGLKAQLGIE